MRMACTHLAVVLAFVASALVPTLQSKADGQPPDSGRLFEILVGLQNEPGVSFAVGAGNGAVTAVTVPKHHPKASQLREAVLWAESEIRSSGCNADKGAGAGDTSAIGAWRDGRALNCPVSVEAVSIHDVPTGLGTVSWQVIDHAYGYWFAEDVTIACGAPQGCWSFQFYTAHSGLQVTAVSRYYLFSGGRILNAWCSEL